MAKCVKVKRRRVEVCIGDLNEWIFVENRELGLPEFGSADADFAFTPHESATGVWALVETITGTTTFDDVTGLDRNLTHRVIIRILRGISAETWLRLDDGRRLDIVDVTNLDERGQFMEIRAAESGSSAKAAAGQ